MKCLESGAISFHGSSKSTKVKLLFGYMLSQYQRLQPRIPGTQRASDSLFRLHIQALVYCLDVAIYEHFRLRVPEFSAKEGKSQQPRNLPWMVY